MTSDAQKAKNREANKKILKVLGAIIGVLLFTIIAIAALNGGADTNNTAPSADSENKEAKETPALDEFNAALAKIDDETKHILTSESLEGTQGDFVKAEADGKSGVKVTVSTHFTDSKGVGKEIARKLLTATCMDAPSLKSLYVISQSTELQSISFFRSDAPACDAYAK